MRIKSFIFNDFQENTYVVYDDTKECIIIDPGCYLENEKNNLKQFIVDQKLKPVKLINTHCHIDHILGNKFVCNYWNVDLHIHKEDFPILNSAVDISKIYGFDNYEKSPNPKHFLKERDKIYFGKSFFEIIFTPGHSPGHISLYSKKNNILLSSKNIYMKMQNSNSETYTTSFTLRCSRHTMSQTLFTTNIY